MEAETPETILEVHGLRVETVKGVEIVDEVSFNAASGEVLALVGESGCGKTSTALALLGYARPGLRIATGTVTVDGTEILGLSPARLQQARGRRIAYVPQDPSLALNPRLRVGTQLVETLTVHGFGAAEARARSREAVERVGLAESNRMLRRYPFELSGGEQQRLLIAMALVLEPSVVVLDEPTTGLDVTTQSRVLEVVKELASRSRTAFVYVTHDLAVVDQIADRVAVMYGGRVIEVGPAGPVLGGPSHPYTTLLLQAVPRISERWALVGVPGRVDPPEARSSGCFFRMRCPLAEKRCAESFPPPQPIESGGIVRCWRPGELELSSSQPAPSLANAQVAEPLLEFEHVTADYGGKDTQVLHDVSFTVVKGECVALVGESGSGKSTIGRCLAGLHAPTSGRIRLHGEELAGRAAARSTEQLRAVQLIFQNPDRSLNPSQRISTIIERPLVAFDRCGKSDARRVAARLLERVHLSPRMLDRYPHELSGGEKQRVAIARGLAADLELLICDEVTSSLDVSVQASIVQLLDELRANGLAILFITHDLGLVNAIAERAIVLQKGVICEQGATSGLLRDPQEVYTQRLIAAAPDIRRASGRKVA